MTVTWVIVGWMKMLAQRRDRRRHQIEEVVLLDRARQTEPVCRALGTRHTDRTVRGYNVTCSAPKSVSVLFAFGDDTVRQHVIEHGGEIVPAICRRTASRHDVPLAATT